MTAVFANARQPMRDRPQMPKPVVEANGLSIGKVGISTTPGSKTPEPIDTKLGVSNCVGEVTLTSKYGSNRYTWVVWAHA